MDIKFKRMTQLDKIDALVFEGGGVKGIAHCGALRHLEYIGLNICNIKYLAGTSAGSQVATLIACGYTVKELSTILLDLPLDDFKDKSCGFVRNLKRLLCSYGIYKGDFMEKYMDELIADKLIKKNATFMDLYLQTDKTLRITGTCLTTSKLEYFDVYKTPDMPLSKAIRISSSIPLFYVAVKYNDKHYIDGGIIRNLPVLAFPNKPSIFFTFKEEQPKETDVSKVTNIVTYLLLLLKVAVIYSNKLSVEHGMENNHRDSLVVVIDTKSISGIDFDLDDDDKKSLLDQGREAVVEALNIGMKV